MSVRGAITLLLALAVAHEPATAEKPQRWLEVRSSHFTVITNGSDKQARRVVEQFEQIRAVFHLAFPHLRVDTSAPVIVLGAKDEKTFQALEPEAWKKRGRTKFAGLFLRGPEKNLVLLRLDLESSSLLESVFHEYTHVLLHQNVKSLPVWVDEGLAGFYGHTRVLGKEIHLGYPSESHVRLLRDSVSLPLETLLQVDRSSPYYNEQDKGSILYAQSWALTHYLMLVRSRGRANPLVEFVNLVNQDMSTLEAAARAFGDLGKLRRELDAYVRGSGFQFRRVKSPLREEDLAFTARELSTAESAAHRGDFLAHIQRYADARALLEEALREDPQLALAHESMGFIELRQGRLPGAKKWFSEAVRLDSRSYLAHYYFAVMGLQGMEGEEESRQIRESLRAAVSINPEFAPAYDALAAFYAMQGENIEEAYNLGLRAVQLEPGNARFRVTVANVLMRQDRAGDALRVLELALPMAKSPQDQEYVQSSLDRVRQYQQQKAEVQRQQEKARAEREESLRQLEEERKRAGEHQEREQQEETEAAAVAATAPSGKGKPGWSLGRILSVACDRASLELTLQGTLRKLRLHSNNYFKIEFVSSSWNPPQPFNPCQHLQGHQAAIAYRQYEDTPYDGEIVSIEVRK